MKYRYCPVCGREFDRWNNQLLICKGCGYHFYQTSKPTAGAVIVGDREDGRKIVLLTRRGIEPFKGYWDIPGGFLKNGEDPVEGLRREIREELGTELLDAELFFSVTDSYPRDDIPEEAQFTICLYFICHIDPDTTLKAEDDITESKWFPLDEIPEKLSFNGNKLALEKARELLE